jgi:hypothetical protein
VRSALALRLSLLPLALASQWAGSLFPEWVERLYAQGLYPFVARLGSLSGALPFSLGELALVAALLWTVWRVARFLKELWRSGGRRFRVLAAAAVNAAFVAGIVYAAFLLLWGFNYYRQPFAVAAGLGQASARVEPDELAALAQELVEAANEARAQVNEDERGVARIDGGPRAALRRALAAVHEAAGRHPFVARPGGAPKAVVLSEMMSYLGLSGIFSPYTVESNVNRTLPEFELPFSACHELAHQAGLAFEGEANYFAYVATRGEAGADFRYSGALNAAFYALGALRQVDAPRARSLGERWSEAVRRDLKALSAWNARYRGPAQRASRAVNDAYLRAHGQPDGVRSYGRMVDLLVLERRARVSAEAAPSAASGA